MNAKKTYPDFNRFLCTVLALGAVKQVLVSHLPIYAISTAMADDAMMVRGAHAMITNGLTGWLGHYDQLTLVKGFFFPAFLAFLSKLGISYIGGATLLYTFSCFLFVQALRPLLKSDRFACVLYAVLLFNPASFAGQVLQRVYRNSITQPQTLLILGSLFALYIRREQKLRRLLPWALTAGLAWASLEHSREDAVWILPAAMTIILITAGRLTWVLLPDFRTDGRRFLRIWLPKMAMIFLPVMIFAASHPVVSLANYLKYGIYSYNELNDSHFADAMKALYGVKMEEEDIYCVSVSRAKLQLLYGISPTLNSIHNELEYQMDEWADDDRTPDDREVEDGWFFWALRQAAAQAGYHETASMADQFYLQIANEINAAFDDGRLERQPVMPSALMPPWRKGRGILMFRAMLQVFPYMSSYQDMAPATAESVSNHINGIPLFEAVTRNRAIYPEDEAGQMQLYYQELYQEILEQDCARLEAVIGLYRLTGPLASVLGLISWLILTGLVLTYRFRHKKTAVPEQLLTSWLVVTGLAGSLLCLAGGIAYNHVASCNSINYMYLCAGYPLLIAWWVMSAGFLWKHYAEHRTPDRQQRH